MNVGQIALYAAAVFHVLQNMQRNPTHYSFLRLLGPQIVSTSSSRNPAADMAIMAYSEAVAAHARARQKPCREPMLAAHALH
jgi:hypothetical protein